MAFSPKGTIINVGVTGASAAIANVLAGVTYLVSASTICYLNIGGAAVAGQGIMVNPAFPLRLRFGEYGGAAVDLRVIGTAGQFLTLVPGVDS